MPLRRFAPALLLLLASLAALFAGLEPVPASAEAPVWHDDYKAALATARDSDKPLFIVFRCVP